MIAGAISAEVVAFWYNGTPMAMACTMLLFAACAFAFWLVSSRSVHSAEGSGLQHHAEELVC
jgi:hypothetical protein